MVLVNGLKKNFNKGNEMKQLAVIAYSFALAFIIKNFNIDSITCIGMFFLCLYMWIYNLYGILKEDFKETVKVQVTLKDKEK